MDQNQKETHTSTTSSPGAQERFSALVSEQGNKIKEQIQRFGETALEGTQRFVESGQEKTATKLDDMAVYIHEKANILEDKTGPKLAECIHEAAGGLENISNTLRTKDAEDLAHSVRDLVRKHPGTAIAVAATTGFILARLFRSDKENM